MYIDILDCVERAEKSYELALEILNEYFPDDKEMRSKLLCERNRAIQVAKEIEEIGLKSERSRR